VTSTIQSCSVKSLNVGVKLVTLQCHIWDFHIQTWSAILTVGLLLYFYVLLTVHLGIIFVKTNLTHNYFSCMFISILYMFWAAMCPSSGELIVSLCIDDRLVCTCRRKPAHQTVIYTEWHIPDVVLIQLIFLMMGTWLLETCREQKWIYSKKNCASSWLFTKIAGLPICIIPQMVHNYSLILSPTWYNHLSC
jgi:hypothetical protein